MSTGTSLARAATQRENNSGVLPLLGEARSTQQPRNGVAQPLLLGCVARALKREFATKEIAYFLETDKGNAHRMLTAAQAFDIRRVDPRMTEDERHAFGLALIDELRKELKVDNDEHRLARALDALQASLTVIAEIARKGLR